MNMGDFVITNIDRRERLRRAINKMGTPRQKIIVILYLMGWTQTELAAAEGCKRQRIQQIIAEFRRRNGLRVNG